MKSIFTFLIVAISLSNCSDKDETPTTANMRVNYYTEKCIGEMEGECLLVQEGANIGSDDWQFSTTPPVLWVLIMSRALSMICL